MNTHTYGKYFHALLSLYQFLVSWWSLINNNSYTKIELWLMRASFYLIDLEICSVEWEATSHCCSAWYLLRGRSFSKRSNQKLKTRITSCFLSVYTSTHQNSPSDCLCLCFSSAVAWNTCIAVAQATFTRATFTFWKLNWICSLAYMITRLVEFKI